MDWFSGSDLIDSDSIGLVWIRLDWLMDSTKFNWIQLDWSGLVFRFRSNW